MHRELIALCVTPALGRYSRMPRPLSAARNTGYFLETDQMFELLNVTLARDIKNIENWLATDTERHRDSICAFRERRWGGLIWSVEVLERLSDSTC